MTSDGVTGQLAPRHVLQFAYYDGLSSTRAVLLEQCGYVVTSATGNDKAEAFTKAPPRNIDLALIGFSGIYAQLIALLRCFKRDFPAIQVAAMQAHARETFAEAGGIALSDQPEVWLGVVRDCFDAHARRG